MPTHETDPVGREENLYRRALYADLRPPLPYRIERGAFTPSPRDLDGLSAFRTGFTSPEEVAEDAPPNLRGTMHILEVAVATVLEHGASVVPAALPAGEGPRGHSLIPELSYTASEAAKQALKAGDGARRQWMKEFQFKLATEAANKVRLVGQRPVVSGGRA